MLRFGDANIGFLQDKPNGLFTGIKNPARGRIFYSLNIKPELLAMLYYLERVIALWGVVFCKLLTALILNALTSNKRKTTAFTLFISILVFICAPFFFYHRQRKLYQMMYLRKDIFQTFDYQV